MKKYSLSFVAGALLHEESVKYIEAISNVESYLNKKEEPEYHVIPTNSESSKKRYKMELNKRFRNLNAEYLNLFKNVDEKDQKIILFLAICKTYKIITEFSLEVLNKKWRRYETNASVYDFEYFLSTTLSNEQYESITEKTRYKAAQVAIKIFKDLGMLEEDNIKQIFPSDELKSLLLKLNDNWFFDCLLIQS